MVCAILDRLIRFINSRPRQASVEHEHDNCLSVDKPYRDGKNTMKTNSGTPFLESTQMACKTGRCMSPA